MSAEFAEGFISGASLGAAAGVLFMAFVSLPRIRPGARRQAWLERERDEGRVDATRLRDAAIDLLDQWDGRSHEVNPVRLWENLRQAIAHPQGGEPAGG